MAKILSNAGIVTGLPVEAEHVSQSVNALTAAEAYDINISGSLTVNNLKYPIVDGAAGQSLLTDGAGNITIQSIETVNTSSYVTSSNVYGPFGADSIQTASYSFSSSLAVFSNQASSSFFARESQNAQTATSASYALTASYLEGERSASYVSSSVTGNIITFTKSDGLQVTNEIVSSSYALTASYAISASHEILQKISSSYSDTSSYAITASYALSGDPNTYISSSTVGNIILFNKAGGSSDLLSIPSSSYATTSSYAETSSYAVTASYIKGPIATASYAERAELTRQVSFPAYNDDNVTITAGTPLYVREVDNDVYMVRRADAGDINKMPAAGVASTTVAVGGTTELLVIGEVKNLNTFGTNVGKNIYVASGSGYTQTKPLSPSLIQPIGIISEEDFMSGKILINGPMADMSSGSASVPTASYVSSSNVDGPYGFDSILTSSYALTASYALNGGGGSGTIDTGSLLITASILNTTASFTKGDGSIFETYITNAVSSSYATTASYAITSSHEVVHEESSSYAETSSYAITASYVLGGNTNNSYREAVTGATSYTITHNLNENFPIVQAYEQVSLSQEIPAAVISTSANAVDIIFINNFDGTIVVIK